MDDISPQAQARYEALLSILAGVLEQENYTTQILGPQDDMPIPTLLVAFGMDEESRERSLGITIMPLGDNSLAATELVQFYRYVLAVPNNTTIDGAMFIEVVALIEFHQENFADYLEGIIDQEISLTTLPELIARR